MKKCFRCQRKARHQVKVAGVASSDAACGKHLALCLRGIARSGARVVTVATQ